ncbi:MAG: 4Fe-4S dicluster domain-containing protein [Sulfurimonas sp.]|nr:4Fe-4S dicluster domain-containing protein [Sulfurimonas sp.]
MGADKQRIWVSQVEKSIFGQPFISLHPSQCNHCLDAPCVDVCPTGSSYFAEGGIVMTEKETCILCKACMEACPYDARFVDDTHVAVDKCNFCYESRLSHGETTTACQATCPTKVRLLGDIDDEESDLVKMLKERKFYVLKEDEGTVPKLFYLLPEHDDYFAMNSVAPDTNIYTWETYKPIIEKAKAKRKPQWQTPRM